MFGLLWVDTILLSQPFQIPSKLKEALKQVKEGIEQRLREDQKLVSFNPIIFALRCTRNRP